LERVPDHPAHEWFKQRYEDIVEKYGREFERALEDGTVREDLDPETAARWLIAMADGLRLQWLLHPDVVDHVRLLREFIAFVRAYLTGAPYDANSSADVEFTIG